MLFSDYQIFRFLKAEIFFFSKVYKCQSVKKTLVKLLWLKQCLEPHFLNPSPMVASDTPLQNLETSQNKGEDTHALIVLMKRPKHRELKNFSQGARCKVQQDPASGFSHLLSCAFSTGPPGPMGRLGCLDLSISITRKPPRRMEKPSFVPPLSLQPIIALMLTVMHPFLEVPGRNRFPCLSQSLVGNHISQHMTSSSIFKARNVG